MTRHPLNDPVEAITEQQHRLIIDNMVKMNQLELEAEREYREGLRYNNWLYLLVTLIGVLAIAGVMMVWGG